MLPAQNKLPKYLTLLAALLALLVGALPFPVLANSQPIAQSDKLQSALGDVSQNLNKLDEAAGQLSTMDSAQETEVRRTALTSIFDLTLTEITDLSSKETLLTAQHDTNETIAKLAKGYINELRAYQKFIELLKRQATNETMTLQNLKTMAADFKDWRSNVYEPRTKHILDFLLFLQAKSVLTIADSRLIKINSDLKKLNLIASQTDVRALNLAFQGAQKNLSTSHTDQNQALSLIVGSEPTSTPEATLVTLRAGGNGVFTCLPSKSILPTGCTPVFRRMDGKYYLLEFAPDEQINIPISDVYQGSGALIASVPAYVNDAVIGAVDLISINQANASTTTAPLPADNNLSYPNTPTADASEAIQTAIKQTFSEIIQAYKKFFAMSLIARVY